MSSLRKILSNNSFCSTASARTAAKDPRIIIIGAGLAGLSAAQHLIRNHFKNLVILEASNRYGGRIQSVPFGDTICELGAKWVPVEKSSDSIMELVSPAIETLMRVKANGDFYMFPNGQQIHPDVVKVACVAFNTLFCSKELPHKISGISNAQQYLKAETEEIARSVFRDNYETAAATFHLLMRDFSSMVGSELEQVHVQELLKANSQYFSGAYLPAGMESMLKLVTHDIEHSQLQLGKPIGQVSWREPTEDGATVGCLDGSSFSANHIICTLPLGSLKNFAEYIFDPPLPQDKLAAIANLGFGVPCKLFLEYPQHLDTWYSLGSVKPVWTVADTTRSRSDWAKDIIQIAPNSHSKKVLEVTISPNASGEVQHISDEKISNTVTEILRKILKKKQLPLPSDILRTTWASDARYLGGQPFLSTTSREVDVRILAAPLPDNDSLRLLFAGDATMWEGFGTIDGARRSGRREAQRIIDHYTK